MPLEMDDCINQSVIKLLLRAKRKCRDRINSKLWDENYLLFYCLFYPILIKLLSNSAQNSKRNNRIQLICNNANGKLNIKESSLRPCSRCNTIICPFRLAWCMVILLIRDYVEFAISTWIAWTAVVEINEINLIFCSCSISGKVTFITAHRGQLQMALWKVR